MKPAIDWGTAIIESHYQHVKCIFHSGKRFKSYRYLVLKNGAKIPIWPVREYLIRTKHSFAEVNRIIELNKRGIPEGYLPLGVLKLVR